MASAQPATRPGADVAELADAQGSGPCGPQGRGGSTPLIRNGPVHDLPGSWAKDFKVILRRQLGAILAAFSVARRAV